MENRHGFLFMTEGIEGIAADLKKMLQADLDKNLDFNLFQKNIKPVSKSLVLLKKILPKNPQKVNKLRLHYTICLILARKNGHSITRSANANP